MKFRFFILTYKAKNRLEKCARALANSDAKDCEIFIINNHSDFSMPSSFSDLPNVKVLNNELRADWSTGHMSRSWNQALIFGFESLKNPSCDAVVTIQDDVAVVSDVIFKLKHLHKERNFSFVQNGHGDALCSYLPEAIIKSGMWDERFLMGLGAADYFYRQLMFNTEGCSINDPQHERYHNLIYKNHKSHSAYFLVSSHRCQDTTISDDTFSTGGQYWIDPDLDVRIGSKIIDLKYGFNLSPWNRELIEKSKTKKINSPSFIQYSYFEKDIPNLSEKGYIA